MATPKPNYIHSQTYFDADRWDAHAKVGELMAQGITQIAVSFENGEWTVSWPLKRPVDLLPTPPRNVA
jgi:hypothetical protein